MTVRSLGRRTDFIFARFSGSVEDKGSYTLIQTPSNPGYHWGNYIVFDKAPRAGDLRNWKELFDKEFPFYSEPHHYVFTWDTEVEEKGECHEFLDEGFEFDSAVVLTAKELSEPRHMNNSVSIRKIESNHDWNQVIGNQTLCADPKYLNEYYEDFKRGQMGQYRRMKEAGKGNWFGAFSGDKLVGDLGVYFEGDIARYQSVCTHPEYRRRGICGTLVFFAGQVALKEYGVQSLVMEADPDYHAARIYESVGFKRSETNYSLSWWKG